jgi:hypothetical protein
MKCRRTEDGMRSAASGESPSARAAASRVPAGSRVASSRHLSTLIAGRLVTGIATAVLTWVVTVMVAPAWAENVEVSARRSAERTGFTNEEIVDGFFKIAFGAEFRVAGGDDRIRKFEAPVRVFIDNRAQADRSDVIAAVVADIRQHVDHLDIEVTRDRRSANVVVTLVRNQDLKRTIRSFYGPDRARQIEQKLNPECLSGFSEDAQHRIRRAEVILTADSGDFRFADCAYEELLQALGPINDDRSVPWTMFNDEVQMGFFDVYDQYLLNILYDARVRPGMTRDEVKALLPDVLPQVRTQIARKNPRVSAGLQ